jgi:hypothetical protein
MHRTWAIVEREMRRFSKSPMMIVMSMIFPLMQLVVLGYAFGGNVKHLKLAIVDQDHGVPAVKIRELATAVSSGARTRSICWTTRIRARRWVTCATAWSTAYSRFRRTSRGVLLTNNDPAWPSSRTTPTPSCRQRWPLRGGLHRGS